MPTNRSLILASQDGICRFPIHPDGSLGLIEHTLRGVSIEAISQDSSSTMYAGSDEGRIYQSRDGGQKWIEVYKGFPNIRGLWSLTAHPIRPGEIYAGLEPVALWVSRDAGEHWEELSALREHPASANWHFYDPMKPHVRSIAFDHQGSHLYIGIEVGGVLASRDGGRSFEDKSQGVDEDVHVLQVVPDQSSSLFAMTGGGLFRSIDWGEHWKKLTHGLERWYMVPLVFAGDDLNVLCVGAGNPPPWKTDGADAAIYISENGGESWRVANGPFPLQGMLSSIVADPKSPESLFAGTTDGAVLISADGGKRWKVAVVDLPRIEEMVVHSSTYQFSGSRSKASS